MSSAREKAAETDNNVRAQNFNQAKTYGVPLPEERFPDLREGLTKAKRAHQLRINGVAPPEIAKTLGEPEARVGDGDTSHGVTPRGGRTPGR